MTGFNENNPIGDGYHATVTDKIERTVDWTEPGLKIIRMRFLSDRGFPFWDLSYCHGQLSTGEYVDVQLPFNQLKKFRQPINRQIVEFAKLDGINAKSMGIFNVISTLN